MMTVAVEWRRKPVPITVGFPPGVAVVICPLSVVDVRLVSGAWAGTSGSSTGTEAALLADGPFTPDDDTATTVAV
jgi:hypothetical protein